MVDENWILTYDTPEKGKRSYGQESLMTLGNGYIGWRGAPIWSQFSDDHYPGLYLAGVFNRTTTEVAGRDIVNEDMVNLPNPQLVRFFVNDKQVDFAAEKIQSRKSSVNFKTGVQSDSYTVMLKEGHLTVKSEKYVDPVKFHNFGVEFTVVTDFDGELRVESVIDGTVENMNVERYRDFDSREFDVLSNVGNLLIAKTHSTDIEIVVGAKTRMGVIPLGRQKTSASDELVEEITFRLVSGKPSKFDKIISVASSYESENPRELVQNELSVATVESIKKNARTHWEQVWRDGDIIVDTDDEDLQRMIRMNIFHIRQAAQHKANQYLDASVGSRGLTGEGYRGHIFWDEIFVVPYYAANDPETARDVLRYRINRLEAAQENAYKEDEKGAMYPWQSGLDGDEQSQTIHLNTVNNEWEPDNSRRQRHVSLAIVYDLWIYYQLTGDISLLNEGGLDVLLETTKFWLNKAQLGSDGRYHISGVMGPDEYHEAYPGAKEGGIRDNAYTNLMLTWALNWLLELPKVEDLDLQGAAQIAQFNNSLAQKAIDVSHLLFLDVNEEGIIAQYDGYFDLKEVDFAAYEKKYGDIHRIDRLMKADGKSPDDYQVAKQADTLMTIYNLGADHMERLVRQLGYDLPEDWLKSNRDYYLSRTVHGSTTSRPVFAGIDVTLGDLEEALDFLITAIGSDYYDIQGGTTAEGVHIGVMGETLEVVQNEFGGVCLREGQIEINPCLPDSWHSLAFTQKFRDVKLSIGITHDEVVVKADRDITVLVYGDPVQLFKEQVATIEQEKEAE